MEMLVETQILDDDLLEDCKSLQYLVEIGEIHERDKYAWTEYNDLDDLKLKKLEFDFKMSHIKQTVRALFCIDLNRSKQK